MNHRSTTPAFYDHYNQRFLNLTLMNLSGLVLVCCRADSRLTLYLWSAIPGATCQGDNKKTALTKRRDGAKISILKGLRVENKPFHRSLRSSTSLALFYCFFDVLTLPQIWIIVNVVLIVFHQFYVNFIEFYRKPPVPDHRPTFTAVKVEYKYF